MKLFTISDSVKAKIIMFNSALQLLAKAAALFVKAIADNEITLEESLEMAKQVGGTFLDRKN